MATKNQTKVRPKLLETFSKNFNVALDEAEFPGLHYGRQVEVSRVFQITKSAARKWVMGDSMPDWDNMVFIADTLNISVDALLGRGTRLKAEPTITIPIGIADPKSEVKSDWIKTLSSVSFEERWLENGMRMQHADLQLVVVSGNHMSPTLDDGDTVFVDTRANKVEDMEDNSIYLLKHRQRALLRRVQIGLMDTLNLVCDNKEYPDVEVPTSAVLPYQIGEGHGARETDTIAVIGKVQWAIKRVAQDSTINPMLLNSR